MEIWNDRQTVPVTLSDDWIFPNMNLYHLFYTILCQNPLASHRYSIRSEDFSKFQHVRYGGFQKTCRSHYWCVPPVGRGSNFVFPFFFTQNIKFCYTLITILIHKKRGGLHSRRLEYVIMQILLICLPAYALDYDTQQTISIITIMPSFTRIRSE